MKYHLPTFHFFWAPPSFKFQNEKNLPSEVAGHQQIILLTNMCIRASAVNVF
jgi:hypothetical protein